MIAVKRINRMRQHEIIGQPRLVGQQVMHGYHPLRLAGGVFLRRAFIKYANVFELREEFGNRVLQLHQTLLVKHHQRDRGDRLGHGVNTENRFIIDGKPAVKSAVSQMR